MRQFCCFLLSLFCPLWVFGQTGKYVRVKSVEELVANLECVFVSSVSSDGAALSAVAKNSTKLAVGAVTFSGDTLVNPSESLIWKLVLRSGGYAVQSNSTSKYLATKNGTTQLYTDSYASVWKISSSGNCFSVSITYDGSTRQLGYDSQSEYFGSYAQSQEAYYGNVFIYRKISSQDTDTISPKPTPSMSVSEIPDFEKKYSLATQVNNNVYAASSRMTTDYYLRQDIVTNNLLADSTLVIPNKNFHWHFSLRSDSSLNLLDDDNNYYLSAQSGNGLLSLRVQSFEPDNFSWFIKGGNIYGKYATGNLLQLVLSNGDDAFYAFSEVSDAIKTNYIPVTLIPLAPDSSSVRDSLGTIVLSGGWSAAQIAELLSAKVTSLDMTQLTLPLHLQNFTYQQPTNALIYVSRSMQSLVPDAWPNVIVCDSNQVGHAVRVINLVDRYPFFALKPFSVGADSLSYTRSIPTDKKWNTLYLPFSMDGMPSQVEAFTLRDVTNSTLALETMGRIPAYTPMLIRYSGVSSSSSDSVVFNAEEQVIAATPLPSQPKETVLVGNLQTYNISSEQSSVYFLASDGNRLVCAANGSYLDSFRCYLQMSEAEKESRSLQIGGIYTSLSNSMNRTAEEAYPIYTIQGISLGYKTFRQLSDGNIPSGIYIWNHRKIYIPYSKTQK